MVDTEPNRDERHKYMREYDRERRQRAKRLFHWSLDMPPEEDDVDVRVNKGMTWKEMAVIAAAGLGGLWMVAGNRIGQSVLNPTPPTTTAPQTTPADSEYEVRFYDASGRLIDIPHIRSGQGSEQ